jgi:aminopeptidase N
MVLETAVSALNSFNERFGLYPYEELDLISAPMTAGGMEYSSAVALSLNYYNPGYRVDGLIFLESAAAHEVGHQWFFNQVMSDQLDEPWLDEGLVQYATYLYFVDRYDEDNARGFVNSWTDRWQIVEEASIPIGKPAREYSRKEYGPIIYGRAPFFFMELRNQIGEATFDQLLRNYTDTYRWGISDTQAFKDLAEENCACDLTPLFEQWVYD